MNKRLIAERELLSGPGDDILEIISYYKISKIELAKKMGITTSKIYSIIAGKEPITLAFASQLEKVLGISTQYWINREMNYRKKLMQLNIEG